MAIFRNLCVRLRFKASKYINVFLRLKSSPSLTLQKISHSRTASEGDQIKKNHPLLEIDHSLLQSEGGDFAIVNSYMNSRRMPPFACSRQC